MKYIIDHDFHIHSVLSPCSSDPEQNPERILQYAKEYDLKHIVITDHFWDALVPCCGATWQGFENIEKSLPLPKDDKVNFHFGCEADMDRYSVLGIHPDNFKRLEFIVVPINHLHLGFELLQPQGEGFDLNYQKIGFLQRFWNLLMQNLPFHKMGLAHITWDGVAGGSKRWQDHLEMMDAITDDEWKRLFSMTRDRGMGVEINVNTNSYAEEDLPRILRPHAIAKDCGCKFYIASDAHHPADFEVKHKSAEKMIDLLNLTEEDKFRPFG